MVEINFWKMHGLGNDYIVIDNRDGLLQENELSKIAKKMCLRRYSIGADGLLLIFDSNSADTKMRIFNADGSEAEMCGNGIRCFVKYCYENELLNTKIIRVETIAGVKEAILDIKNDVVKSVKVNLGKPSLLRHDISMRRVDKYINKEITAGTQNYKITCLSIGNPHCVLFVNDVNVFPVLDVGPKIENHHLFFNRTNVEFVQILNRNEIKVRVWERGCGETLACGTGACASAVAGNILGLLEKKCIVHLLGGDLNIEYNASVMMEGPAEKVYEGTIIF